MDMNEIYSPSTLISKSINSVQKDPFFVILAGSIQIMITTAHWTSLGLAISSYQTFLPEVINHPGIPNLLAEMALVFGIVLIASIFLVFVYIFDSLYRNISLQYLKSSIAGEEVSFESLTDTTGILKMLKWRGIKLACIVGTTFLSLLPGFFVFAIRLLLDYENLTLIAMVLSFLFYIPAMGYLKVSLYNGDFHCAFGNKSPVEILKHTWVDAKEQRLSLFIFNMCRKTIILIGIFICYIPSLAFKGATLAAEVSCFLESSGISSGDRQVTGRNHQPIQQNAQQDDDVHPFLQQSNQPNISPNTPIGQIMPARNTQRNVQRNQLSRDADNNRPPPRPKPPKPPRR